MLKCYDSARGIDRQDVDCQKEGQSVLVNHVATYYNTSKGRGVYGEEI